MVIVRTENLTKVYVRKHLFQFRKTEALRGLNIEVEAGTVYGLLGLNGSGKTTFLKLLVGLLFPTEGRIYIFGERAPRLSLLSRIGYLPEFPSFMMYLSSWELLNFYGKLYGFSRKEREKRVNGVLDLVGLTGNKDQRLAELSKGMLERIGLAQVLLHDPQLLLLDEPTSGLDPLGIRKLREIILRLKTEGRTIIISSHLVTEVERVCDQVGILHEGRLKAVINTKSLQSNLEDVFVQTVCGV